VTIEQYFVCRITINLLIFQVKSVNIHLFKKTNPAGEKMKRFIIEQSDDEFYTSHSGLALAGLCLNRYSKLSRVIGRKMDNT